MQFNLELTSSCKVNFSGSRWANSINQGCVVRCTVSDSSSVINFRGVNNWVSQRRSSDASTMRIGFSLSSYESSNFNGKVILPDVFNGINTDLGINYAGCFRGLDKFNSKVDIYNSYSCASMFSGCSDFNSPVNIVNPIYYVNERNVSDSGCSCANMFENCPNFNQSVTMDEGIISCASMFANCTNFNQPVTVPNDVLYCNNMFRVCNNFNSVVNIGEGVISCASMFYNCSNYNQPVTIPDSVLDCSYLLYGCSNFNQTIKLSEETISVVGMLNGCNIFNQPLYIPDSVTPNNYHYVLLSTKNNYNSVIDVPYINTVHFVYREHGNISIAADIHNIADIGFYVNNTWNNALSMTVIARDDAYIDTLIKYAFRDTITGQLGNPAINTNEVVQKLILPEFNYQVEHNQMQNTAFVILSNEPPRLENEPPYFGNKSFNEPVDLSGLTNCSYYFRGCTIYNQPTTIPNTVERADGMFANCVMLNQPILFEE